VPPAAGAKPPAQPAAGKPATAKPAGGEASPGAGKPVQGQAGTPAKPAAKPATGAAASGAGAGAKPAGKSGVSAKAHKPAPVKANTSSRSTGRRLGQVLIDLGYLDEDQLWAILEEAKSSGTLLGQAALTRGLITEIQLQQALADQFGLKFLPPEELKPTTEALGLVPETMASVYKVLPLSFKDNILTVVLGDPSNLPALDDLRNFLGVKEVTATLANPSSIAEVLTQVLPGQGRVHHGHHCRAPGGWRRTAPQREQHRSGKPHGDPGRRSRTQTAEYGHAPGYQGSGQRYPL
jgi:type IV pilus assembly protein PilB